MKFVIVAVDGRILDLFQEYYVIH